MKLKLWRRDKDFAVYIYKITRGSDFSKDFSFRDQMRNAAVSITSYITERDELVSNKKAVKFFYIAKSS